MPNSSTEEALLKTLEFFAEKKSPITKESLFNYLLSGGKRVDFNEFNDSLNGILNSRKALNIGGEVNYIGLPGLAYDFNKPHVPISKFSFPFILLFAVENHIFNDLFKDVPRFYVFVKNDTKFISKFLIKRYLKFNKCFRYELCVLEESELKDIYSDKDLLHAGSLISLVPLINNYHFYEYFISKNLWIFNHFTNFPLEKINISYRSSYKVDGASIYIKLLNKIVEKIS